MNRRETEVAAKMRQSNAEFARKDGPFQRAFGIVFGGERQPTARQASKFRNKRGLVFQTMAK